MTERDVLASQLSGFSIESMRAVVEAAYRANIDGNAHLYRDPDSGELCAVAMPAIWVTPIPMRLPCPDCGVLHIDEGEFATKEHHTHACQFCGAIWRPAIMATVGVRFLPGFKNS